MSHLKICAYCPVRVCSKSQISGAGDVESRQRPDLHCNICFNANLALTEIIYEEPQFIPERKRIAGTIYSKLVFSE